MRWMSNGQRAAMLLFAPLPNHSRAAEVTRQLVKSIDLGLLPAGTQLPPEAELAEQLGVSTMTLREALATLREQGLLITRRGRGGGSFVQSSDGAGREAGERALRSISIDELRDLLDHQAAVSSAIAKLAAERAGASEIARLRTDIARFEESSSAAERRRADARFHVDLAVSSHSARLTAEEVRLQGELSGLIWLSSPPGGDPDAIAAEHEAILAGIIARDPRAAREAAEVHANLTGEVVLASRLALDG
jgi:GntR family transcriptional regulator, transcriptional repressor for pyruvate dehydrogenase complex